MDAGFRTVSLVTLPILQAFWASLFSEAEIKRDRPVIGRRSGILDNNSFHCRRTECAALFRHKQDKAFRTCRGQPSRDETRSRSRGIHRRRVAAKAQSNV